MTVLLSNSVNRLVSRALAGDELSPEQALQLLTQTDPEAKETIRAAADELRAELVGEPVSYVINRNVNFTNICEQHCSFCAFRRDAGADGSYWLDLEVIQQKVREAAAVGATEICLQGGLNPQAQRHGSALNYYVDLVQGILSVVPGIHLHAFSPQEVQFIARQDGISIESVIQALQAAGIGSMPGTAAEILVPEVRRRLCPEKITAVEWLEIVATAHAVGVPTTSTMLSGHIESMADRVQHLEALRSLQKQSQAQGARGVTEFILLPYVGESAPKALRHKVGRDQPELQDALVTMAVARLFMGAWIRNHQPSWVKLGLEGAAQALNWGCNDIGGTLMEEHITSMAGAKGGTGQPVETLQQAITSVGRPSWQRTTMYEEVT